MSKKVEERLTSIETVTCSRCGGGGQYSWCQSYGTRCFKCSGSGKTMTKRGAMANLYLIDLLSKTAAEVLPGMKYRDQDPLTGKTSWILINEVSVREDGDINIDSVRIRYICPPTTKLRIAANAEEKTEAVRKALDYQMTLSKTGKVRSK